MTEEFDQDYIIVGKITGAHGLKGTVKIHSYTQHLEDILQYETLWVEQNEELTPHTVTSAQQKGNGLYLTLQDVRNRNDAESLKNCLIYIHQDELIGAEEDEFFYKDLINMNIVDEHQQNIGTVKYVHNFGASDILEIEKEDKTTFFLAFTKENVPHISLKTHTITIALPEIYEEKEKPITKSQKAAIPSV